MISNKSDFAHGRSPAEGGDGAYPHVGRIADRAGNLYGTTQSGGASKFGSGTVFKLSPSGTETVLYSFTGGSDGANPEAGLIADRAGNLYGTTMDGGASYSGASSSRRAGPRWCCTPLRAAATGLIPKPA